MAGKTPKLGFNIKLSEETTVKLNSEDAKRPNSEEEPQNKVEVSDEPPAKVQRLTVDDKEEKDEDKNKKKDEACSGEKTESEPSKSEFDAFAQYVRYEGTQAIYTDPSNGNQYLWNEEGSQWLPRAADSTESVQDGRKYSVVENVHVYTEPDGSVYFWDEEKKAWFPKVDEDFLAHYQMAYGFVDNASKPETEAAKEPVAATSQSETVKKGPSEPKWFDLPEDQNNKVYVSNLPTDITDEEFVDLMQKCGLVMKDPSTQKLKIKLYTKPNSKQPKGDALCTYIRVESVQLALDILDGYNYKDHRIKVQRAKFQMKGDFNPALKPKKKKKKDAEKLKKMQDRLFDWRPEKMRGERSKHERVVIIKNLFEPSLFDKEVHLILEYQQDMREECSKCGEVKKVHLYDRHPEGVCQVTMKEPEEAESVVKLIDGRWFGKRQLTAQIWDGKTKYKMEETDSDLNKRLDGWNKFLDEGEDKAAA